MPSTFAHAIVPSSCLTLSLAARLTHKQRWHLLLVAVFLGNSPDLDLIPAFLFPAHFDSIHRNFGHNLFSIMLLCWLGAWLLRRYVSCDFAGARGWGWSIVCVTSHLFLDCMCGADPDGIRYGCPLFWPLSSGQWLLPWPIFPSYSINLELHPLLAFVTSRSFWHCALFSELGYSAVIICAWFTLIKAVKRLEKLAKKCQSTFERTSRVE
ncbi:MAG: metal-dependent hydrolase [Deltaproteobacteria bacterium]|nr:metal-dependent hydrolase [Deltaproteobacteria bacterium]